MFRDAGSDVVRGFPRNCVLNFSQTFCFHIINYVKQQFAIGQFLKGLSFIKNQEVEKIKNI